MSRDELMAFLTAQHDQVRRSWMDRAPLLLVAVLVAALAAIGVPQTVAAHTGFEFSTPADGAIVDEAVSLITIRFTGQATPVGDQFVALTPEGIVQAPVSIETVDDQLFSLRFDPPLTGGAVGVRWNVQAADSHPIEGAFSFTVNAPAPTTVPVTVAAAPEVAATTTATAADTTIEAVPADVDADVEAVPVAVETSSSIAQPSTTTFSEPLAEPEADAVSLDAFLAVDNSRPGQTTATIGRLLSFLGITVGVGVLAFVAMALRGRRSEIRQALAAIGALGALVVAGALTEYVGVARIAGDSLGSSWSSSGGFATVLRLVGGVALAAGVVIALSERPARPQRSLSAAVLDEVSAPSVSRTEQLTRWQPARLTAAILGAAVVVLIASFWFDGHTVSKGFRPLHMLVNSVHIVAGAVWVGGVVAMTAIAWQRHRSAQPAGAAEMVVRFSKIATVALAAVVVAGGVMAVLVLDSFGELTGTQWGKMLLLKTGAVGLAVIAGAYNHFRLLPALKANPDSSDVAAGLRSTMTAEAIMLVFVVMVTAWLVAAAS